MSDCVFCNIVSKSIPSHKVFENEYVYAFKDIRPVAPVHIILVPKFHIESVNTIDEKNSKYVQKLFETIPKIARIANLQKRGYRIISNVGDDGGQTVKHLHFHIIGGKKLGEKLI